VLLKVNQLLMLLLGKLNQLLLLNKVIQLLLLLGKVKQLMLLMLLLGKKKCIKIFFSVLVVNY